MRPNQVTPKSIEAEKLDPSRWSSGDVISKKDNPSEIGVILAEKADVYYIAFILDGDIEIDQIPFELMEDYEINLNKSLSNPSYPELNPGDLCEYDGIPCIIISELSGVLHLAYFYGHWKLEHYNNVTEIPSDRYIKRQRIEWENLFSSKD